MLEPNQIKDIITTFLTSRFGANSLTVSVTGDGSNPPNYNFSVSGQVPSSWASTDPYTLEVDGYMVMTVHPEGS